MADSIDTRRRDETYAKLAALFQHLLGQSDEALRRDPSFAEGIASLSDEAQRRFEEARQDDPAPPDGGLADFLGFGADGAATLGDVEAPPLLPSIDEAVTSERLLGAAGLYYVMRMEIAGLFRAVTALQENFRSGDTRLTDGEGAYRFLKFDDQKTLRSSQRERREAYARVFGLGAPSNQSARRNAAFSGLYLNFIQQVSHFFRDTRISTLFQQGGALAGDRACGSIAMVRRAGLNLRGNLKQASYGHVKVLRIEVMQMLRQAHAILDADDVKRAYGAEDAWDALDQVHRRHQRSAGHFTGSVASQVRLAEAVREILIWLAQPYPQASNRATFETALLRIGDACDEVLTTKGASGRIASIGFNQKENVIPFRRVNEGYCDRR
ncbi:MAG: hypothetical protein AAF360_13425 [Pseudomonadota bacterium]